MRYMFSANIQKNRGNMNKLLVPVVCSILIGLCWQTQSVCADKNAKIVIVGAGSSGFAAANRLMTNGFKNVELFEAGSRHGGRIYTKKIDNGVVELGAEWVHGEKGNVVYEMAENKNLLGVKRFNPQMITFTQSDGSEMLPLYRGKMLGLFFQSVLNDTEIATYEGTIKSYLKKKWKTAKKSGFLDDVPIDVQNRFFDYYENFVYAMTPISNWENENGIGFAAYKDCEGSPLIGWNADGYENLFKLLKNEIPDGSKSLPIEESIKFNTSVSKIVWDQEKAIVSTSDGKQTEADKVIVTVSLGVLKHNYKTMFEPNLPESKVNAIKYLEMGPINKVILTYAKPWWTSAWGGYSIIWTEDDTRALNDDNKWLKAIIGVFPLENQPNLLSLTVLGDPAIKFESFDDDFIKSEVGKLVARVSKQSQMPTDALITRWNSDPLFYGGYSYRGLAAGGKGITAKNLREPLKNLNGQDIVYFAGEATHDTYFANVHGAVESGFMAADKIIASYTN